MPALRCRLLQATDPFPSPAFWGRPVLAARASRGRSKARLPGITVLQAEEVHEIHQETVLGSWASFWIALAPSVPAEISKFSSSQIYRVLARILKDFSDAQHHNYCTCQGLCGHGYASSKELGICPQIPFLADRGSSVPWSSRQSGIRNTTALAPQQEVAWGSSLSSRCWSRRQWLLPVA